MKKLNEILNISQLPQQQNFQKMKDVIKKDAETKNLELDKKEDIILVYNYLQQKHQKNNLGYQMKLRTQPYIQIFYQETSHSKQIHFEKEINYIHTIFNQSCSFNKLQTLSLEHFQTQLGASRIQILKKYWKTFQNAVKKRSLYLQGDFETGKTYFFKLIMKYFFKKQQEFLFLFMPDLPRQFKQQWFDEKCNDKMTLLKKVPYLFLDDLGAENLTIYFRDDILYPLLNHRQENELITFISSNLNFSQLINHFMINEENKQEIKALRMVHQIKKMCQFYCFNLDTRKEALS